MPKSVLILGAGASFDYGLPTGAELLDRVENLCRAAAQDRSIGQHSRFLEVIRYYIARRCNDKERLLQVPQLLLKFADLVQGQLPVSIDRFLGQGFADEFPHFPGIGKLAIVWVLAEMETATESSWGSEPASRNMAPEGGSSRWYRTFWQSLGIRTFQDFERIVSAGRLRVITFNYDRSFDQFLKNRAVALYNASDKKNASIRSVDDLLGELDLCHVYGQLDDVRRTPYGALRDIVKRTHLLDQDFTEICDVADRLVVIDEHRESEQIGKFEQARKWIEAADRLVILGFGFDKTNVERLGFPSLAKPAGQVFATSYGVGPMQRLQICQKVIKGWKSVSGPGSRGLHIRNDHYDVTIGEYLHQYQPLWDLAQES